MLPFRLILNLNYLKLILSCEWQFNTYTIGHNALKFLRTNNQGIAEDMVRVLQFDAELKAFIIEQQTFIEDLIRVQKVFAPFLERVHHRSEFLSNEDYEHICRLHGDALNAVRALRLSNRQRKPLSNRILNEMRGVRFIRSLPYRRGSAP